MRLPLLTIIAFVLAFPLSAQLSRLDPLVGKWRGSGSGKSGDGVMERECTRILHDRFIECRTTVKYEKETHVELAIFSFDKAAKKIRMRQFHGEGFVNTYVESDPFVFETESIENVPPGWRAREAYAIEGDQWNETFSLAGTGKEFEVYSKATLTRVK